VKSLRQFGYLLMCLLLLTGLTHAQGVGASGDIKGTITDTNGAVVANATVSATDTEKGTKRTTTTDSQGQYRISGLPPAVYDVSVEGSGFQSSVMKGVSVHTGETLVRF
jgi:Protocatechuate 3,4-dioxygenase beta subunit